MGILITSANFVGKYAIPKTSYSDLDAFINDTEEDYLIELFGSDMYADFKSNLTGTPPAPTKIGYLNIYNKFSASRGSRLIKSKGMISMLCGFIFFDYMRQVQYQATSLGMATNTPDTSVNGGAANLYVYLNEATESFQAIQYYISSLYPELFPPQTAPNTVEFNGQGKGYSIPFI